jgi:hypothetical protein
MPRIERRAVVKGIEPHVGQQNTHYVNEPTERSLAWYRRAPGWEILRIEEREIGDWQAVEWMADKYATESTRRA